MIFWENKSSVYEIPSFINNNFKNKKEAITLFLKYTQKIKLIKWTICFIASLLLFYHLLQMIKYMIDLVTIFQNSDKLKNQSEIIKYKDIILKSLPNRYLMVKDYDNFLGALNAMSYSLDLKKALSILNKIIYYELI